MMNIQNFAKICGCSLGTVSNAFSAPEKVKQKTLQRILELAEEYHYRPNRVAAATFTGVTKTIGVILYSGNSYFQKMTIGIQNILLREKYIPILIQLDCSWERRLEYLQLLVDQRVDGIIMVDVRMELTPEELQEFQIGKIPCLFLGESRCAQNIGDHLRTDDYNGGILAAEHLLGLGHKRFAIKKPQYTSLRMEGFRNRLLKEGIVPLELPEDWADIMKKKDHPTAIFFYADSDVVQGYDTIRSAGLSVPEDVSVVGFADLDLAKNVRPMLTTILQDGIAMGEHAAEIMLRRLKNRDMEAVHELIPVTLIQRDSTASVPEKKKG